jgi:hypothetical protein
MHRRGERRGERGVKKSAFASEPRRVGRHTWLTVMELGPPVCGRVAGTHARPVTGRPVKWCLTLTSGPWPLFYFIFKIFKHPNFEIRNGDLPDV